MRLLTCLVPMDWAGAALAHDGFHPHPHGVEYGWLIAGAVCIAAAAAMAWRRK